MEVENKFLKGAVLPPIIRFSIPLMLSLVLQALYGAVDLIVVGYFSQTSDISAVATGSQTMQAFTTLVTGLTMGVTVCIGQAVGAGDNDRIGRIAAGQIKLFSVVTVVITAMVLAFCDKIVGLMNVPAAACAAASDYIKICASGMIFITGYNGVSGFLRGMGNSKTPFLFVAVACGINIVLDLVFVGIFGWGAAGAAAATVAAQGMSLVFSAFYLSKMKLPFRFEPKYILNSGQVKKIFRIGGPIALQDFLLQLSFLAITAIINVLGVTASAGVGIAEKMFVFLSLAPMSFMSALSVFTAQNIGAGSKERAAEGLRKTIAVSLCFGFAMFCAAFFFGDILAGLFTDDKEVISSAFGYLRSSSYEYILISVSFCLLGYFNGLGKTAFVMTQGILTAFLVRVPLSYAISRMPGVTMYHMGFAVSASALVAFMAACGYYVYIRSKDKKEFETKAGAH